jgi:RNA polymerase sigma-70 factor (ECF subfamily)
MLLCSQGSRNAFELLYERYKPRVYSFLYRLTGSSEEAEDLLQETFLKIYRHRRNYKPVSRLQSWIYTVARNSWYDAARKNMTRRRLEEERIPSPSADSGKKGLELKDRKQMVKEAVDSLPPQQKECLVLHRFQNLSYAEIAEICHTTAQAVKQRVFRAHTTLRKRLEVLAHE